MEEQSDVDVDAELTHILDDLTVDQCHKYAETAGDVHSAGVCVDHLDLGGGEAYNIVATAQLVPNPRHLVKDVQLDASDSRFRPWILARFFGVRCTCLVFGRSGSCVFVGLRNVRDIILVTQMLVMYIWRTKATRLPWARDPTGSYIYI